MIEHDVAIIGAGLAGLRVAIEAQSKGVDVAVFTKLHAVRSHSDQAQGGINAALGESDSWEKHTFDTIKGSDYLADQDTMEAMCKEAPQAIIEMVHIEKVLQKWKEQSRIVLLRKAPRKQTTPLVNRLNLNVKNLSLLDSSKLE